MFIIIVFWFGRDNPSGLILFRARLTSFHTHASLRTFCVCFFILFDSCCSHAPVFGKTLVHELIISYSHSGEGGWFVIFRIFKSILFFVNWISLYFFFFIKYYHILFIILVFRFGCDKLVSCFFYCLSQEISHGMWLLAWGRVDDFSFSIIQVHFVFC